MGGKILLCMDDGMADIFRDYVETNSESLDIVNNIALFHSLRQSLTKFRPDIVYIAVDRVHYDSNDYKNEVLKTIFSIKSDGNYPNLRFAVQTNLPQNNPFLKKLATRGVYDIFNLQNGHLDMGDVVRQLSDPANIGNVSKYLAIADNGANHTQKPLSQNHKRKKEKGQTREVHQPVKQTRNAPDYREVAANQMPRRRKNSQSAQPRDKRNNHRVSKGHERKLIVYMLLFIILLTVALIALRSCGNSKVEKESYSSLIKKKKYGDAASAYPEKATQTENKMLDDPTITDKASVNEEISQYSEPDSVKFDKAYFDGQFKSAIKIYNNSADSNLASLNKSRKTMLAYCYLKTGDVASAKHLASQLNNSQLNDKIDTYAKFKQANTTLNEKVKSGQLSPQDEQKARDEINKNKQAMDKL